MLISVSVVYLFHDTVAKICMNGLEYAESRNHNILSCSQEVHLAAIRCNSASETGMSSRTVDALAC